MKRRELALALTVQLLLAAALAGYLSWRPKPASPAAVVELKGAAGYVTVIVDGRTVYQGEMHSLTSSGVDTLSTIMARWIGLVSGYEKYYYTSLQNPYRMRVGYDSGYSDSYIGKSYGWNSTHSWFSITGSFTTENTITLKWVSLWYIDYSNSNQHVVSNDTLPDIQVPGGSSFSIVIRFIWRDYGVLTVNFFKQLFLIVPEAPGVRLNVTGRDGQLYEIGVATYGCEYCSFWCPPEPQMQFAPRMFLIVSNRSNPPPPSRSDYDMPEIARYTVSYAATGKGIVFSATIDVEATEVGLVARFRIYNSLSTGEMLIMRWVPPQPLKPGTTVRIYLVPP
ncbi:MAG: hypothetical protein QW514_08740 [Thermoprotei archaeon]